MPSRQEVLKCWNSFDYNINRNLVLDADGEPFELHLPGGHTPEDSRPIGDGLVLMGTEAAKCISAFVMPHLLWYGGRQLITVDNQYLGLASIVSRPGDQVWVLPGLHAPAILRPIKEDDNNDNNKGGGGDRVKKFEFMGTAYIRGIMEGSLVHEFGESLETIELV